MIIVIAKSRRKTIKKARVGGTQLLDFRGVYL